MTMWKLSMLFTNDERGDVEECRYYSTKEKAINGYNKILSSYKEKGEYEEDEDEDDTIEGEVKCLDEFLSSAIGYTSALDNVYYLVQVELEEIELDNGQVYVN